MHTEQNFEQKMSKLTARNQSFCLQNNTDIHCHHSQHTCRLTEPTHVLRSAEDCEITRDKKMGRLSLRDNSPPVIVCSNIHHLALAVKASVIFENALMFVIFSLVLL